MQREKLRETENDRQKHREKNNNLKTETENDREKHRKINNLKAETEKQGEKSTT